MGKLIREGSGEVKAQFEELLQGKHLHMPIDELTLTNGEVRYMFEGMVRGWFTKIAGGFNGRKDIGMTHTAIDKFMYLNYNS